MSTTNFDAYQQVFALSMLSNKVTGKIGTAAKLQNELQHDIKRTLTSSKNIGIIGNWSLVWGPEIFQAVPGTFAANAMFVAHNANVPGLGDTYVVAIAATNSASIYDWVIEDFNVSQTANFNTWNPIGNNSTFSTGNDSEPFISAGTAIGVQHLLAMQSPSNSHGKGTSLTSFLTGLKNVSDSTLIFTGHSLAGALSPTLALYLKTQKQCGDFGTVLVYPTAGATPGNGQFAQLFNQTFPATSKGEQTYQVWNTLLWNNLDVVPHAWGISSLQEIPSLYNGAPADIQKAVKLAQSRSQNSNMTYSPIQNAFFNGTLNTDADFTHQAVYQHIQAYFTFIADVSLLDVPQA